MIDFDQIRRMTQRENNWAYMDWLSACEAMGIDMKKKKPPVKPGKC